ncbi:pyridoxal phosphate-dependent aminotransferase [Amycolatopsis jejuensis]|uniref:pyridoxal phosphate-dependent aminotransferase n=1 Tax=Amycolatopsis jejuensis TaxID=330084 RepID=UPI0005260C90|nr:pyridoxal phosphate-dependent aminotransferase [Amycolatopsis jejuensis]
MSPSIARHISAAPTSGVRDIAARVASLPDCIRLEVGQPDFRTPQHICDAAKRAIDEGRHGYTPTQGIGELRELIAAKVAKVNDLTIEPEQVLLGNGGTSLLADAVLATCEPGDEVLIPDPYWPTLRTILAVAGARAVRYSCRPEWDYQPDLDQLRDGVTPRTKAIVVNSPNNPTGAVYPASTLAAIGEIAAAHGLWVISDECYDQIVAPPSTVAPSMATFADPDRVITAMAFSKTYAMTGWRIGYGFATTEAVSQMLKVADAHNSCINTISQLAAIEALTGPQDAVVTMNTAYRARAELAHRELEALGIPHNRPDGAFYLLADISASHFGSAAFSAALLRDHSVAVTPGSAFGSVSEKAVRISLASSEADLVEGIHRIGKLVEAFAR